MIVRELLALLGYKVDEQSEKKAEMSIDRLKEGAIHLAELFAEAFVSYETIKGIYEMVQGVAELGERAQHTALMLGVDTKAIQELQFAASQFSVDASEMTTGLRFLARSAYEASTGSKEMQKSYHDLGITVTDSNGKLKDAPTLLEEASDKFAKMTNKTERTALAMKIFGRSGASLIPMLVKGSAEIRKQREEAEALGGVMSDDLIEQSEKYIQTQKRLGFAIQGVKNLVGKELLPFFTQTVEVMVQWVKTNREWIKDRIHASFDAALHIIRAMAFVVKNTIEGWSRWLSEIGAVGRALMVVAAIVTALALIMTVPELAIAALVLLVAALIDDWQTWLEGGDSLIGHWIGPMSEWIKKTQEMKEAWNMMVEGIASQLDEKGILRTAIEDIFVTPIEYWQKKLTDFFVWFTGKVLNIAIWSDKTLSSMLPGLPSFAKGAINFDATANKETFLSAPKTAGMIRNLEFNSDVKVEVNGVSGSVKEISDQVYDAVKQALDNSHRQAAAAFSVNK